MGIFKNVQLANSKDVFKIFAIDLKKKGYASFYRTQRRL